MEVKCKDRFWCNPIVLLDKIRISNGDKCCRKNSFQNILSTLKTVIKICGSNISEHFRKCPGLTLHLALLAVLPKT